MSKFIFENDSKVPMCNLNDSNMVIVCKANFESGDRLEEFCGDGKWWATGGGSPLKHDSIFRVLAKPYTLEDALLEVASSEDAAEFFHKDKSVMSVKVAHEIINKLAASMEGGDK